MAVTQSHNRFTRLEIDPFQPVASILYENPAFPNHPTTIVYNVSGSRTETVTIDYSAEGHPILDGVEFKSHFVNIFEGRLEISAGAEGGEAPNGPTAITLTNDVIPEGEPIGTVIGILNTIGGSAPYTYSLVGGDTDKFSINGSNLETAAVLRNSESPYSLQVLTTDADMNTAQQIFNITATQVPITNVTIDSFTVQEGSPVGTPIANISTEGGIAPYTYSLSGQDASKLQIVGNQLQAAVIPNFNDGGYVFDITSTDSVGNEYTTPFIIIITPAPYTSTLETTFDGATEYCSAQDNPAYSTQSFSMSFWTVLPSSASSRGLTEKQNEYVIRRFSNGQMFFVLYGDNNLTTKSARVNQVNFPTNQKVNIVWSYDSTAGFFKVFINGTEMPLASVVNNPFIVGRTITDNEMFIGRSVTQFWNQNIDEVSYWNKALTESEAGEIYNSGSPQNLNSVSFTANGVSWWKMGEGSSNPTILDDKGTQDLDMYNMDNTNFVPVP